MTTMARCRRRYRARPARSPSPGGTSSSTRPTGTTPWPVSRPGDRPGVGPAPRVAPSSPARWHVDRRRRRRRRRRRSSSVHDARVSLLLVSRLVPSAARLPGGVSPPGAGRCVLTRPTIRRAWQTLPAHPSARERRS